MGSFLFGQPALYPFRTLIDRSLNGFPFQTRSPPPPLEKGHCLAGLSLRYQVGDPPLESHVLLYTVPGGLAEARVSFLPPGSWNFPSPIARAQAGWHFLSFFFPVSGNGAFSHPPDLQILFPSPSRFLKSPSFVVSTFIFPPVGARPSTGTLSFNGPRSKPPGPPFFSN